MTNSSKVAVPTLTELRERPCTPEELQAALVHLIERHNHLVADLILVGQSRIRPSMDALLNTPYGI